MMKGKTLLIHWDAGEAAEHAQNFVQMDGIWNSKFNSPRRIKEKSAEP